MQSPALRRTFTSDDGLELVADWTGPVDGPVVLLAHGGGRTRRSWKGTLPALAAQGWEAAALDLRGHGDSQWSPVPDYTLPAYAADLRAAAESIACGREIHLVGASLGGLSSLLASTTLPGLRSLVLVDVVPEVDPQGSEHIREFIRSHPEGFVSVEDAAAAVASFHGEPFPQAKLASLARNLRTGPDGKLYWHWDPARLREGAFACNDIALLNDAASRLALPALLLRGEFSGIVTDKGVTALQRLVPQLQVQVIPGAGHDIPRDNYPAYEQALLAFLGDARASSG